MTTVGSTLFYDHDFPETFEWALVDQVAMSEAALLIASEIKVNLTTAKRNLVPGLRKALNIIAGIGKVDA